MPRSKLPSADLRVIRGSAANMRGVETGSVQLVLGSPPYFSRSVEERLLRGRLKLAECPALARSINRCAASLSRALAECVRVLAPTGTLILQTRDVRLLDRLVAVEAAHRGLVETHGLVLVTRYLWRPMYLTDGRRRATRMGGAFGAVPRPVDPEVFLVFRRPGLGQPVGPAEPASLLGQDFVVSQKGRVRYPHRHQAPMPMLDALIGSFSQPGDLVLDPFTGHGTTLCIAGRLGRRAVGYEVDREAARVAELNIEWEMRVKRRR